MHGSSAKENRSKHISTLQLQVYNLYDRATIFYHKKYTDLEKVFNMKQEKRAKKGVVSLKTWMKLATDILVKVEKREAGAI